MLVPTMTPEEIHAEIFKDAGWLQDEINNKLFKEYGKRVKRITSFPDVKIYERNSRETKIHYYIVFFSYRRSEWDKPHFLVYTKYTHESGRTLVYLENNRGMGIRIYTSHFIQRYLEREVEHVEKYKDFYNIDPELLFIVKNRDVEEMKLFDTLLKDRTDSVALKLSNIRETTKFWQDPDYDRYTVACISGVCLCERNKKNPLISIYDTYLSLDILKPDQAMDYVMAYARLFVTKMQDTYPRQSNIWGKEWNDYMEEIKADESDANPLELLANKIEELSDRYPLHPWI